MGSIDTRLPRIGVGVMVWHHGRLLLGERIRPQGENCWQFPGGHLEFGETVVECAHREVLEEAGIRIRSVEQCGYTNEVFVEAGRHYVTLYVTSGYAGGELRAVEPDKCRQWRWFEHDRLPQPLFLPIRNYLKAVGDLGRFCVDPGIQAGARR